MTTPHNPHEGWHGVKHFWRKFSVYIDPDSQWFSGDKLQHGGAFVVVSFLTVGVVKSWDGDLHPWFAQAFLAFLICAVIGVVFELGQVDTARNKHVCTRADSMPLLGQPGFGFGLLDLVWDIVGTIVGLAIYGYSVA